MLLYPTNRVLLNILPRCQEIFLAADNVLIIPGLPDFLSRRSYFPVDPFCGNRLKGSHHAPQCRARALPLPSFSTLPLSPQRKQYVNVIGHNNIFLDPNRRKTICKPLYLFLYNDSPRRQFRAQKILPINRCTLRCTHGHKICPDSAVIITGQPDIFSWATIHACLRLSVKASQASLFTGFAFIKISRWTSSSCSASFTSTTKAPSPPATCRC